MELVRDGSPLLSMTMSDVEMQGATGPQRSSALPILTVVPTPTSFNLERQICGPLIFRNVVFRLDALAKALSVIATATWLAGWVAGCPSHSGIVSKRQNVTENFFDHLKAPSF